MVIKCFKKLSFRNSPFSSPSPLPVSWRPRAPQFEPTSHLREMFAFLVAQVLCDATCPGFCRLGPVPGALVPGTHRFFPCLRRTGLHREPGWESSRVWAAQSRSLLLRLDLFFHLKHQRLLSYSANKGTYTLPYFFKKRQEKESAR